MQQTTSPAPTEPVTDTWDQAPDSVPAARRKLHRTLRRWGLADLADDSALVLSELLGNAVKHARGPDRTVSTRFSMLADCRGVRIEVLDADAWRLPRIRPASGEEDVQGRGLRLVEAYTARRWGIVLGARGKAVWGEVTR